MRRSELEYTFPGRAGAPLKRGAWACAVYPGKPTMAELVFTPIPEGMGVNKL